MSKLVGLVVAASALIVLISAGLLYATDQEKLEQELNEAAGRGPDEVEKILKTVPEGERDSVEVDGLSVNQILSFRDTSCSLEDLAVVQRIIRGKLPLSNRGVSKFVNFYMDERKKSCGEKFHDSLKEAVAGFKTEDVKKVKELNRQRWFYTIESSARKAAKYYNYDYDQDARSKMCVRIIKKLSEAMRFDEWKSEKFDKKQLEFIKEWYNLLETCKRYTETICRLDISLLPSAAALRFAPWYDECKAIRHIGKSDKSIKEYKNSKPPKFVSPEMNSQAHNKKAL